MTSLFLLLYYTDVVGIAAAAVGTMFLRRPVLRRLRRPVRRAPGRPGARTRWGKFRPFILFGSLPLLLISVATFSVPGGLGSGGKLVYAYITYALLGLLYSLVNIPYGSLASAMTQVPTERAKLATFRVIGSNLTILMLAFVVAPQIKGSSDLQRSLTITTCAFVVAGSCSTCSPSSPPGSRCSATSPIVSMRQSFGTLGHNRPLLLLCLSSLMFLTGLISLSTVGAFYARDVLGNANLFIVLTLAQTVGTFAHRPVRPAADADHRQEERPSSPAASSASSRSSASPWPRVASPPSRSSCSSSPAWASAA